MFSNMNQIIRGDTDDDKITTSGHSEQAQTLKNGQNLDMNPYGEL